MTMVLRARGAVIGAFASLLTAVLPAPGAQSGRQWSEIKSPSSWSETTVPVLIPASGPTPSRPVSRSAKNVLITVPGERHQIPVLAVGDPFTDATYVVTGIPTTLGGTRGFYVADQAGLVAVWLFGSQLSIMDSFVRVPGSTSMDRAIGRFAEEFTAQRLVASQEHRRVSLSGAPSDFFLRGSHFTDAALEKAEVQGSVLQLQLRSHYGGDGTFWVNLQSGANAEPLDQQLITAVARADAPAVKALLEQGANPEVVTSVHDGITPIMLAASGSTSRQRVTTPEPGFPPRVSSRDRERDDRPVMELLLKHGAKVDARDGLGRTALWWSAVYADKVANTQFLLDHHANPNSVDLLGSSPLVELGDLLRGERVQLIAALLAAGADPNARTADQTPILFRAVTGPNVQFAKLLLDAGADFNATDRKGMTPLMVAVRAEQIQMTRMLLQAGASVETEVPKTQILGPLFASDTLTIDLVDIEEKTTALILAASARPDAATPLVRLLLDAGANATGPSGDYALERASVNGYVDAMRLLLSAGANPNALVRHNDPANDWTLLMRTSQRPRVEPVELLLQSGARLHATQRNGFTALMWAVGTANNAAVIKLLLAKGANPNVQDTGGHTPLMKAVTNITEPHNPARGYVENVRALLEGGADVGMKNHAGGTALTIAQARGYPDIVALLRKAGR